MSIGFTHLIFDSTCQKTMEKFYLQNFKEKIDRWCDSFINCQDVHLWQYQKNIQNMHHLTYQGPPGQLSCKESACNAGDPGLIPGLGSPPGEEIGYPIQYSQSSPVVHMVKNLPAMLETWVQALGWEDPLEEGMAIHSSILAWRIPMDRGTWRATVHGVAKSGTRLSE